MPSIQDGPASALFAPLPFKGSTVPLAGLAERGLSGDMAAALDHAPSGDCVAWGIPFHVGEVVLVAGESVAVEWTPRPAEWLVFMHTSDVRPVEPGPGGFFSPMRGEGQLAEHAADYVICYADGSQERIAIRRRHELGAFRHRWGEECFACVPHAKPHPWRPPHEQPGGGWGFAQTRVVAADGGAWINWLWAWPNPHPDKPIAGVRFEPKAGAVAVAAISAGSASSHPLRWQTRRKAVLTLSPATLPAGQAFAPELDERGLLRQIQLDLGQVIAAVRRPLYPDEGWAATYNNQIAPRSENEILVEYTAHPDACFHLDGGQLIPVRSLDRSEARPLQPVAAATQRVVFKAVERGSGRPVPVKLHVHGEWGEYLAPLDRHRIANPAWFEDYSVDFVHGGTWDGDSASAHTCTYIPGETTLDLPLGRAQPPFGKVYVEVSKGFEIRPVRQVVEVGPDTREVVVEIEKVLPWRAAGWVSADTHVHFLSPMSALLEGSAEGVNVVNLLVSQWGELMTNVGDFDGRTTWGLREAGGDDEYLVRVGTENRQHVLGHISLLGYNGRIIAPMTTGGPDESALGDPVESLLTEWARQCKKQGGLVVVPHFPNPRAEHAAAIVSGEVDGVEMTAWGNLYGGIDPYSLSDWYRYLNCGHLVAAVGGTDKMSANTAVGAVRTYARIARDEPFTYRAWMDAVRRAETFVTYGPLLEFAVDGRPMGSRIDMPAAGGSVDVVWQVASVTVPMSRVELIVNGEIRESAAVAPEAAGGTWRVKVERSCWLALLVRGHYADKPEIVAAHSSPVMVMVDGSPLLAAADAVTILDQIEGALAYLDTVGTRAEDAVYKRMRLVLVAAHRSLHNRLHQAGAYHEHTPTYPPDPLP
jgi:hypothetical protein